MKEPKTKLRYVICVTEGKHEYRSKSYKTERGAIGAADRMRKKYGPLGYTVTIDVFGEIT